MSAFVMVIDDSTTIRKIVEITLRREGFSVQSFPDGVEAVKSFQISGTQIPDLVILDIDLPKMNGYEIARYLRSKPAWKETPMMMLSRHNGVVDRLKARLAGVHLYLSKPFTTQALIQTVQDALSKRALDASSSLPISATCLS
ncbi:response regulator [Ktedonobacter racemifer]|uniref:Response regulator receiver protein n=1 Tax=Ktedonobacter racemifer DSM 44963 TaxID=485913 RepID=D6TQ46_KTERA|nr:response regulator [Ktedonobacter racemifer]EFH85694.1 response regulator receiver protein [Ktedonobacter racemifer DSM 44963]